MDNNFDISEFSSDNHPSDPVTNHFDGDDPSWAVVATEPRSMGDAEKLLRQWDEAGLHNRDEKFIPVAPKTFNEAGIRSSQVEALVLKFLLSAGTASGRDVAAQLALPFAMIEKLLNTLKLEQLLGLRGSGAFNDFEYQLTSAGADRARRYAAQCTYFGSAPVDLESYIRSVKAQAASRQRVSWKDVHSALEDLVLHEQTIRDLGEALNLGQGLFLCGASGNGKTAIAQRLVKAYSPYIWIPRAICLGGEIVRVFDPIHHQEVSPEPAKGKQQDVDRRWVRIRRPTITLDSISSCLVTNEVTGISEASLQLKSNCGVLILDDFGDRAFEPAKLLHQLILPLQHRNDIVTLPGGRTFRVPFDAFLTICTHHDPLVGIGEAFLRRVPFKVDILDPTDDQFRSVFQRVAEELELEFDDSQLGYLLDQHYVASRRAKRFCHPRDLLQAIHNSCRFRNQSPTVTREAIDAAFRNLLSLNAVERPE